MVVEPEGEGLRLSMVAGSAEANQFVPCSSDVIACRLQVNDK